MESGRHRRDGVDGVRADGRVGGWARARIRVRVIAGAGGRLIARVSAGVRVSIIAGALWVPAVWAGAEAPSVPETAPAPASASAVAPSWLDRLPAGAQPLPLGTRSRVLAPPAGVRGAEAGMADGAPGAPSAPGAVPAAPWRTQWPYTVFEAAFTGPELLLQLGATPVHARVSVDGVDVADLVEPQRPRAPVWRLSGLGPGTHRVQVALVHESVGAAQVFGGLAVPAGGQPLPAPPARRRAIEFIGDSHTVGYGLASPGRDCSDAEVWRHTDTSRAFGPQVARQFDADVRVLAISGRGVVRNYANFAAPTLPQALTHQLPALDTPASPALDMEAGWAPQVRVIGLGTNDFSTPVAAGEPWADAAALAADFEARYVAWAQALQRQRPVQRLILLAPEAGAGQAERSVRRVAARLRDGGQPGVEVLAVGPLGLEACHWHPSLADHARLAQRVIERLQAAPPAW